MGKGDTRTKRGKINIGSYGNVRKKFKAATTHATAGAKKADAKKPAAAKAPAKKAAKAK